MNSAQYTVVLKSLMEDKGANEKLMEALKTYPMYESKSNNQDVMTIIPTRESLNQKLLNYYKYHEIGFETPGRFFDELEIAMNEIMPYYNQMLHTVEIMNAIEDPFGNVDVTETFEEERTDSSTGQSTTESSTDTEANIEATHKIDQLSKKSDTPQNSISDIDNYLSEATKDTANNEDNSKETGSTIGETTSESSTDSTGTVKHTLTRKGNQGVNTYAHDIIEFRTSILNIEQMIISDKRIRELFMLIY